MTLGRHLLSAAMAVLFVVGAVVFFAGLASVTHAASTNKVMPDQPIALAISRDGDLYVADRGRNEVLEWMPSGTFRVVVGTGTAGLTGDGGPADRAEVDDPSSLVISPNGTLYFAQAGHYLGPVSSSGGMLNTVIRKVTLAGTIRTIAGLHPSCVPGPVRSVEARRPRFRAVPPRRRAEWCLPVTLRISGED